MPPGEHDASAVHALHDPLSQTSLVPQAAPFGTLPVATHVAWPVEQEIAPTVHRLPVEHATPDVHALHVPPLQTYGHGEPLLSHVPPALHFCGWRSLHWLVII